MNPQGEHPIADSPIRLSNPGLSMSALWCPYHSIVLEMCV